MYVIKSEEKKTHTGAIKRDSVNVTEKMRGERSERTCCCVYCVYALFFLSLLLTAPNWTTSSVI